MNRSFAAIWGGQLISVIGSAITAFALSLWVHDRTGSAISMTASLACKFAPQVYFSLFAGHLIDSLDRRRLLLATNLTHAAVSGAIAFSIGSGHDAVATLYLLLFVSGLIEGIQSLALQALPSSFLDGNGVGRAVSTLMTIESLAKAVGPGLAVALLAALPLRGLVLIDLATFLVAAIPVALVRFPVERKKLKTGPSLAAFSAGFRAIFADGRLRVLLALYALTNLTSGLVAGLIAPLVLARGAGQGVLAEVMSAGAVGGIVGGLAATMVLPKLPKARTLTLCLMAGAILGRGGVALEGAAVVWCLAQFVRGFTTPLLASAGAPAWATLVPVALQGRVFGARRLITQGAYPLTLVLGGWTVEHVTTDALVASVGLAPVLGSHGSGIALFIVLVATAEVASGAFLSGTRNLQFLDAPSTSVSKIGLAS